MDEQVKVEGIPISIRASGGATINVTITVNKYLLDPDGLRELRLLEENPTRADLSLALASSIS